MNNVKQKYKYAVIATDVVIFTIHNEQLRVLLIKMKKDPYMGFWACPGGLIKPNESVEEAAQRNLFEKASVKNVYLEQLFTFGQVDRDPFGRVVSVAYFALIPNTNIQIKTTGDYEDIAWFSIKNLPPLAYDHVDVIKTALKRLQNKLAYSNIVYSLLEDKFTLSNLQKIYEIILDTKLDKRNFRKKILSLKIIKETGERKIGEANRPAQLYEFENKIPKEVEIL